MIKSAIFDMDGLMFDTEPIWTDIWAPILEDMGFEYAHGMADAVRGTSGKNMDAVINRYVPGVDAATVRERAYAQVHEIVMQGVPKKPGVNELLEYLHQKGIPMGVASSSAPDVIESNLKNGGIREYFGHLVSGVGMKNSKPAPDIFLKAADAMDADPATTLVLEDSLSGVRAGVAGGFITVMVPDLVAPDDFAREHAAAICSDLFEVRDALESGRLS